MIETAYIIVASAILLTMVLRVANEYDLFKQFKTLKREIVAQRISGERWRSFVDSFSQGPPTDPIFE